MEKYLKAVSEMYLQFKKREDHPMAKYVGRHVRLYGRAMEVVGYSKGTFTWLIVDGSKSGGWTEQGRIDVVFKECESYWYADINNLID